MSRSQSLISKSLSRSLSKIIQHIDLITLNQFLYSYEIKHRSLSQKSWSSSWTSGSRSHPTSSSCLGLCLGQGGLNYNTAYQHIDPSCSYIQSNTHMCSYQWCCYIQICHIIIYIGWLILASGELYTQCYPSVCEKFLQATRAGFESCPSRL